MLFYFKKNKNPNASPRIQLTSLNKELHSLRNNSIDFAEKWRNSYIKFTSKLQLSGTSASFWAENENDPQLYECLNEISIYLTDFETQSKSWLSYQKQWIILLKELSEKEMNYINKEKEYFKILNKLHEITKQIRNYDQEEENKLKNNKIVLKKNNNDGRNSHHEKFSRDIKEEIQEEINKRREGEGEKEKEEEEKSIIIRQVKPVKIDNTKTPSKEDLNPDRNKLNKNKFKKSKQNKNINENNKTKNDEVFNKSIRQKNSYHHLIHLQHKLKKEFLRYFNENQKQLDTIYLIKELKIPTILYKLIQEYSKLWNKFLYTYGKLNGTFQKLQSLSSDKITPNKNTVQKLNLNFDEYDKVMLILEKENDYVKQYHPTKAQHDHLKSWIRNQGKWIRVLEEVFQHQKNHIQFVSKWLHESYKNHIFEKQISMLKLNDIIQYQKDTPKNTISSIMSKTDHEDTEFIHTIINIYNNKITKSNNKYYNLLYKTSIADKKRDEFIKNCDLNPITIISNSEKEEDPSSQISHHHRKLGKSDDDNEKKDNHDHRIDHRLASTQEKKYSHHHVHLSYIYLFQIFGELTSHLEDSILTNIKLFPSIGGQIMNQYYDLKKQSNTVCKVINDIKKGMSGYHDDKLFQVIKNKKKQLGRLKKLEHDYDLQKYKLEGIRKEEYQFRYQEMPKEYERILALLTNTTQEYIELCIKILQEYDILNRRKEHKEKEHLSHKLNHMLNHKTIDESNENNKFNENFGNNENNENKKKIYSKTQDYKYLLEEKKHPESYHTAIKKEALNQKKEKILPTEELMKRSQKKTMKDLSKDSKEKKLINKKSKCLNRSSHNQKNDDYDRSKESINNNKSKKKGERSFTLTGPKDKKLDIISVIESEELIDDFDLTSKTIQEDPSMTYAYPYETSIHSTNDGAAVFSLPNTIQESLINSSKDALSKFPSNIKTNKISSNDIMYSIPSTPPPQYSSPKTKKMNHYYPPPPPLSPIISEFPTFLQQGTEIPITPGSVPIPLSNQHPSAPPLDNYMMNLRTDINVN